MLANEVSKKTGNPNRIPTSLISDTQSRRARSLCLPVTVTGPRTFLMPSATRAGVVRRVELDSASNPHFYDCDCEAAEFGFPCWHAAHAIDTLVTLALYDIRVAPGRGLALPAYGEGPLTPSRDDSGAPLVAPKPPAGRVIAHTV